MAVGWCIGWPRPPTCRRWHEIYASAARALGPSVYGPEQVAAWAQFGRDTPSFRDYVLKARTWVAKTRPGAAPLGFCGIGEEARSRHGEVHSLYVRPGHTRQGLGALLLAFALADARSRGLQHFSAWVTPLSRPLFLRSGFELIETVIAPYEGVLFERYRVATPARMTDNPPSHSVPPNCARSCTTTPTCTTCWMHRPCPMPSTTACSRSCRRWRPRTPNC